MNFHTFFLVILCSRLSSTFSLKSAKAMSKKNKTIESEIEGLFSFF